MFCLLILMWYDFVLYVVCYNSGFIIWEVFNEVWYVAGLTNASASWAVSYLEGLWCSTNCYCTSCTRHFSWIQGHKDPSLCHWQVAACFSLSLSFYVCVCVCMVHIVSVHLDLYSFWCSIQFPFWSHSLQIFSFSLWLYDKELWEPFLGI